jgi:hypothetical protein
MPISVRRMFEHLSRHQPQGGDVRIDVQIAQRIATLKSTCLHKCPDGKLEAGNSEHWKQPFGR